MNPVRSGKKVQQIVTVVSRASATVSRASATVSLSYHFLLLPEALEGNNKSFFKISLPLYLNINSDDTKRKRFL